MMCRRAARFSRVTEGDRPVSESSDPVEQDDVDQGCAGLHGRFPSTFRRTLWRALGVLAVQGLAAILLASVTWAATPTRIQAAAFSQSLSGNLSVGGSTALQPLVEQAARSFQSANPGVQIVVSDGGSGSGRTGVCQGTQDIGLSDVSLTEAEKSSLNCRDAVETAIAMDVFVVAANWTGPGNLTALDREQMEAIFS